MKKMISICLFTVILAICVLGGFIMLNFSEKRNEKPIEIVEATEQYNEAEQTELIESMQVQQAYRYLLIEENGMLVVYEGDGRTLVFETNIKLHGIDDETRRLLREGIFIADEKELYDLLESYSS